MSACFTFVFFFRDLALSALLLRERLCFDLSDMVLLRRLDDLRETLERRDPNEVCDSVRLLESSGDFAGCNIGLVSARAIEKKRINLRHLRSDHICPHVLVVGNVAHMVPHVGDESVGAVTGAASEGAVTGAASVGAVTRAASVGAVTGAASVGAVTAAASVGAVTEAASVGAATRAASVGAVTGAASVGAVRMEPSKCSVLRQTELG